MNTEKEKYDEYEDINNYCSFCGSRYKYGQIECVKCNAWFCDSCDDQRNGLYLSSVIVDHTHLLI